MTNPRSKAARVKADTIGRDAESLVCTWYESRGFLTHARRLRTPRGEIDLIVSNTDTLVFVEVKARRSARVAAESVTPRQQSRLVAAAEIVLATNPSWQRDAIRFDVMLVVSGNLVAIPDAFRASDRQ
ncbi:YraN family protein [Acidiphilium sp.]|uniref:YraN family protein n=1 Tax=Acidiphilium sp. TaxID=527 RepID=UPI003D06F5F8